MSKNTHTFDFFFLGGGGGHRCVASHVVSDTPPPPPPPPPAVSIQTQLHWNSLYSSQVSEVKMTICKL